MHSPYSEEGYLADTNGFKCHRRISPRSRFDLKRCIALNPYDTMTDASIELISSAGDKHRFLLSWLLQTGNNCTFIRPCVYPFTRELSKRFSFSPSIIHLWACYVHCFTRTLAIRLSVYLFTCSLNN